MAGAVTHLSEALRADPDNSACAKDIKMMRKVEAAKNSGNELFKAGNNRGAADAYSEALGIDPSNRNVCSRVYCNRAAALMKLGEHARAIDDCTRAIEMDAAYVKVRLAHTYMHSRVPANGAPCRRRTRGAPARSRRRAGRRTSSWRCGTTRR